MIEILYDKTINKSKRLLFLLFIATIIIDSENRILQLSYIGFTELRQRKRHNDVGVECI